MQLREDTPPYSWLSFMFHQTCLGEEKRHRERMSKTGCTVEDYWWRPIISNHRVTYYWSSSIVFYRAASFWHPFSVSLLFSQTCLVKQTPICLHWNRQCLSRTTSEINGDLRRKLQIFLYFRVFCAPADGSWNWVSAQGVKRTEWWRYETVE